MMHDKYYREQEVENRKILEFGSPANHQYSTVNAKENYFSYFSDDEVAEEDDKEVAVYLYKRFESASIEEFYRCHRKMNPILYQISRHLKSIPAMSAPAGFFFSIVGDVITKQRNNLSPATTEMLAGVKNKVSNNRLCDVDSGIDSGDTNIDDDPDLYAKITWEINNDLVV